VYENTKALPRIFLADRFRVLEPDRILPELLAADFDPAREALLTEQPPVTPETAEGSTAEIVDYGLNRITMKAHIERPCLLVMSEIAYPDWHALIDGESAPVLTANYCLRALSLPPGDHEIECVFRSRTLVTSLIVSIAVFVVVAAVPAVHAIVAAGRNR
jgi:hypothetical protein